MTPDTLPALKSCPFCGEAPISFPSGDGSGLMIECVTSDCVRPHVSYIPPAAAIAKWNTRSEGETERLVEALHGLVRAVNTPELAAAMACHSIASFANVEDALKPAIAALEPHTP